MWTCACVPPSIEANTNELAARKEAASPDKSTSYFLGVFCTTQRGLSHLHVRICPTHDRVHYT